MYIISLQKHPFLLALRRWGREERGQTDVFAGYYNIFLFYKFVPEATFDVVLVWSRRNERSKLIQTTLKPDFELIINLTH